MIGRIASLAVDRARDMPRARRDALIACGILVAIGLVWFATLPAGILVGDDLILVYNAQHGGYASSPLTSLVQAVADKYRPVLTLLFSLAIPVFGRNFRDYEALNFLVELGNSFLVLLIAWRLSKGNRLISIGAGIAFLISRFAYYFILQLFGLMEGVALGFTLLVVYDAVSAYQTRQFSRLGRSVIWFGLAIFTDERYVVVALFVIASIVLHPSAVASTRRMLTFVGLVIEIVVANFVLKTFAFHSQFFTGTAGLQLGFNIGSIEALLGAGLLNVVGFNVGPVSLAGQNAFEGPFGAFFGIVFSAGALIAAVAYFRRPQPGNAIDRWRPVVLAAALFLPLLLSAAVAVRQDPRWLYAPFAVFILALAGAAGAIGRGKSTTAVAVTMIAACVLSTSYYRSSIDSIYFVYSMELARSVRETLANDPPERVVFQTHGNDDIQKWVFANGLFFEEYGLHDDVRYVNEIKGAGDVVQPPAPLRVFDARGTRLAEITETVRRAQRRARISLADQFSRGTINSRRHVTTPTGEGAFMMDWPSRSGPLHSLTILAGFRYEFAGLRVRRGDALVFSAADPYAEGSGTHAFVEASANGQRSEIFRADFKPAQSPSDPAWQVYDVPLERFAGNTISLTFGVDALTGDQTAAWLAFADPGIFDEGERHTH